MGVLFKDVLETTLKEMIEAETWYRQCEKKIDALELIESKREKLGDEVTKDLKEKIEELYKMNEKTTGGN